MGVEEGRIIDDGMWVDGWVGGKGAVVVVGWLLNVPATCQCVSGADLHRQFYVLPH